MNDQSPHAISGGPATQGHLPNPVAVLVGSLRRDSFNRIVAEQLPALAPSGMTLQIQPSLGNIPLYDQDVFDAGIPSPVTALAQAVMQSTAVIIVTPEYNYSVPGVLKNALDWLSRLKDKPFDRKRVALVSASMGALGGVRGQHHLRQVLVALNAQVMNHPEVVIGTVQNKVDAQQRRITDAGTEDFLRKQLQALQAHIGSAA